MLIFCKEISKETILVSHQATGALRKNKDMKISMDQQKTLKLNINN